jgi:hypothetical protein
MSRLEMERVRDFIILHYKLNRRPTTRPASGPLPRDVGPRHPPEEDRPGAPRATSSATAGRCSPGQLAGDLCRLRPAAGNLRPQRRRHRGRATRRALAEMRKAVADTVAATRPTANSSNSTPPAAGRGRVGTRQMAHLNKIVIVGGGSAGWICAAMLSHYFQNGPTQVELVESEEIGTIGVGESTIPPFLQLIRTWGSTSRNSFRKPRPPSSWASASRTGRRRARSTTTRSARSAVRWRSTSSTSAGCGPSRTAIRRACRTSPRPR